MTRSPKPDPISSGRANSGPSPSTNEGPALFQCDCCGETVDRLVTYKDEGEMCCDCASQLEQDEYDDEMRWRYETGR